MNRRTWLAAILSLPFLRSLPLKKPHQGPTVLDTSGGLKRGTKYYVIEARGGFRLDGDTMWY